jgi:CubicO group peptidase (beta-lactamase class C family)
MRNYLLLPCLIFVFQTSFSQVIISGKVLEQKSRKPIPFANIGILGNNLGTLSNQDGSFSIQIPRSNNNDTLQFSALGFAKRAVTIPLLLTAKDHTILLSERVTVLNTVTVTGKKEANKIFELGNVQCKGGIITLDTAYAGRSNSLLIDPRDSKFQNDLQFPIYVTKAHLRIFRNNFKICKFRLRLNEVDSITKAPGLDLLHQNVIVESSIRNGWMEFDLSKLNIVVTKPFFLTFEQITTKEDRTATTNAYRDFIIKNPSKVKTDTVMRDGKKEVIHRLKGSGLDLPGVFVGIGVSEDVKKRFTCYVRETSFAEWRKVRGILTATVTLNNQMGAPGESPKAQTPCSDELANCKAEKICNEYLDDTGIAGMQICVMRNGKIELVKSFGFKDIENGIIVNDSTKFRIASISKSMTSAALVKLVLEGKLSLDAPVRNYLPQFPEKKYEFTARQLAGHLAGFRDFITTADYVRYDHYDNAMQALKVFQNDTLLFKPGTTFHYSTYGYRVLGAIIESITKKNYLTYLGESVFAPLQLRNTCGDDNTAKISNRSKFYDLTGQENEFGDLSYAYAGGGLLSTASDLVKFGQAMLYQTDEVKKLLFTSQRTSDGLETGYGLGWYVGKDKNLHRVWHHSGDGFGYSSHLYIYPDDDLVVAFVANGQEGAAFDIQKLASLYFE